MNPGINSDASSAKVGTRVMPFRIVLSALISSIARRAAATPFVSYSALSLERTADIPISICGRVGGDRGVSQGRGGVS